MIQSCRLGKGSSSRQTEGWIAWEREIQDFFLLPRGKVAVLPCRAEICCRPDFLPRVRALSLKSFLPDTAIPTSRILKSLWKFRAEQQCLCGCFLRCAGTENGGGRHNLHIWKPRKGNQVETHSKKLKWSFVPHSNGVLHLCPRQPHPATHRTQLCYQLGLFKSLFFSVFALKELEPGVSACPGKLHAKASAGAERQPSPGHGHSPTALKVRRSSAPFPISTFPSHTFDSQIPLSAARSSRLVKSLV